MDILKTATGKEFDSDYLSTIPYPAQMFVRVLNTSLVEVAKVFGDPAETMQLWHGDNYLTGYTHLVAIVPEDNAIKVCLGKE